MDNQLIPSQIFLNRIIIAVLVTILTFSIGVLAIYWQHHSDPYIREVLSLEGSADRGYAIFQINCVGCHNLKGEGSVGPSLKDVTKRKSQIELIEQVISGKTPPMPKFQPSHQEMADLLSYLDQL